MKKFKVARGFTLIEILVVIGIIAVLATIVIIAINPARQFAQARDSQRIANLNAILNAVGQKIADSKGLFNVGCPDLPSTATVITVGVNTNPGDLGCLTPTYIPSIPFDPSTGDASTTDYTIYKDGQGRVHVSATELEPNIPRATALEVTR